MGRLVELLVVPRRAYGVGVAIEDFRAVVRALAEPEVLRVFGVVAASDAGRGPQVSGNTRSIAWVTVFGLVQRTSLAREAVETAAGRLVRAGLFEESVDDERGYKSWRVDTQALAAAAV